MYQKKIAFINKRELPVQFSSLVINVKSIENLYPGGFRSFFIGDISMAYTNGFIVVITEMMSYPSYLYGIIDKLLAPVGFIEGRDFVIGLDKMPVTDSSLNFTDIDWCRKADWLHSLVSPEFGNIVWHASFDEEQKSAFENIRDRKYPWCQYWTFFYDRHPIFKDIMLKMRSPGIKVFLIDEFRYDIVDQETYVLEEDNRLPLFLGSQFGLFPRLEDVFVKDSIKYVAVLGKSMLSGVVAGLSIYKVENLKLGNRILFFENDSGVNKKADEVFKSMYN